MKRIIGGDYNDLVTNLEKENAEVAYEAALESFVLLKNDGALPLQVDEVALFGVGAGHTIKGGTGSGEVNNRHSVSIYEGLKNAGVKISSEGWIQAYKEFEEAHHAKWIKDNTRMPSEEGLGENYRLPTGRAINETDIASSNKEVAIYVVSRQSGEGADKKIENSDYNLLPHELNDIFFLQKHFKHLVVIINSGTSLDLTPLDELDISLLFFGQAGQEGGRALADVLTGKKNFSGKLTSTWAKKYTDIPYGNEFSYINHDLGNEYYKEGIYVGYRYYDTFGVEPRFHFGYGLSYTSFDIKVTDQKQANKDIELTVQVKNTGNCAGKEIVQVYVSCPSGLLDKEYQRLVAFKKTKELQPKEEETLKILVPVEFMTSYNEADATTLLEKGDYVVKVGNASNNNKPAVVVEVKEDLIVSKHDNICHQKENFEQLHNQNTFTHDTKGVERIALDTSVFETKTFNYGKPAVYSDAKVDAIINQLNEKELINVCTGIGTLGMMDTNVFCSPGIAGKTTYKLLEKGLLSVNLADGPAGLRLVQKTAVSPRGRIKMFDGYYLLSFMETMPKWMLMILRPGKNDTVFYQFATAYPVGTNLAQTWNEEIVEKVGAAVSKEMDKFNVTYWLAPGMNIQRNPLCGRNFEYYSEDPVVSGKISASMTRGVQSIEGNYTTIKHFACNNVEDNRAKSNSHVSERALREIYLKGFEINVKEAGSKSVMTSYNMVNGTYTSDSYDLCTKVLRNEWGFDGVVMTDWYSTKKGCGDTAQAVANGNDMIMPGDKVYEKELLEGLKNGTVSLEDLRRAAANIIRSIVNSNVAKKYNVSTFLEGKK